MFQEPVPRVVVPLGEAHEHRDQMISCEDQPPVLVCRACSKPD
ncbi:hypothetical protein [Muricoccus nepalensis]|nr:hypothetical protein [Roseomonas nepalensis]